MIDVTPAKLADTKIRVLNASGQGGQAAEVAGAAARSGFRRAGCGERRGVRERRGWRARARSGSGPSGRAAAAAVWLVAPCTELFQDERSDDTVDLAIGTEFTELSHSDDIDAVLASLRPDATQAADSALLTKIHSTTC